MKKGGSVPESHVSDNSEAGKNIQAVNDAMEAVKRDEKAARKTKRTLKKNSYENGTSVEKSH